MKIKIDVSIHVSRIVRVFIASDFLLLAGWGLIGPIFALFVVERIPGANALTVGLAASIYWLTKSVMQIPIANFLDKQKSERMSFYVLVVGLLLASLVAFSFALVRTARGLYLLEFLHSIAFGLYVPAWSGLFSHHLEAKHQSLDWSLDSTVVGIASGITGAAGGALAAAFGYNAIFIMTGGFTLLSVLVLLAAPQLIFPRHRPDRTPIKDHTALGQ